MALAGVWEFWELIYRAASRTVGPATLAGLPASSEPMKVVWARCSVAFALHHRVRIDVWAPGASTMPRPLRVLT
jgi:hypothetical protein